MSVIGADNAMGMFQAGVMGGRTRGPSAIGAAIRGVLEQAKQKGLIESQAMGNFASSVGAAAIKNQFENQGTQTQYFYDETGRELGTPIEAPKGAKVNVARRYSPEELEYQEYLREENESRAVADPNVQVIQGLSELLKDAGLGAL